MLNRNCIAWISESEFCVLLVDGPFLPLLVEIEWPEAVSGQNARENYIKIEKNQPIEPPQYILSSTPSSIVRELSRWLGFLSKKEYGGVGNPSLTYYADRAIS